MQKLGQVVFIHGGDSFDSNEEFYDFLRGQAYEPHPESQKRWRDDLQAKLEAAGYEWLFMAMPNKQNADYEAWEIWFEKVIPFIEADNNTQVIGYSLGACFLLRYLSENKVPFQIDTLHLVAPALSEGDVDGGLGSFTSDTTKLPLIADRASAIHLYHSTDDPICPYADSEKITAVITDSTLHTFTDRGHFFQPEFAELLEQIQEQHSI